jgi:hypothetical protein
LVEVKVKGNPKPLIIKGHRGYHTKEMLVNTKEYDTKNHSSD